MIKVWGRLNSVNVQKVMWCLDELGLECDRVDAGMAFGRTTEPGYLAMNPNGRVPVLEDGDYRLWESNAIMRYLAREYGGSGGLYPTGPRASSSVDRWMDWTLSTVQPAERNLFWGYIRTDPAARDRPALEKDAVTASKLWAIVDDHLADRPYLEGAGFTLADIAVGSYARRWFGLPIARVEMPGLQRWYEALQRRVGFQTFIAPALT